MFFSGTRGLGVGGVVCDEVGFPFPSDSASVFWVFFSVLRKLGAKWRNVEGKLDRPGVVLRYVNSKTYNPRNQRRVYIEKSSRPDDYKSFYLDTPEGPSPNAFGQMQFAIIVSQSKTSASLNTSVYF